MKKLLTILALALSTLSFSHAQTNLNQGGTGWNTSTAGDLFVGTTSSLRYTRLPIGSTGTVLWVNGGKPAWIATSSLGITGTPFASTSAMTIGTLYGTSSANFSFLTASQAVVTDASKNLASLAYSIISSASSLVQRDSNQNAYANNFISKATNVTSAGGTTVLTSASAHLQNLNGSSNQTFQLPDATTLQIGSTWQFSNNSTGGLTITDNSSGVLYTIPTGGQAKVTLLVAAVANGVWDLHPTLPSNASFGTDGLSTPGYVNATNSLFTNSTTTNRLSFLNASGTGITATNIYSNFYPTGLSNSWAAFDTLGKLVATTTFPAASLSGGLSGLVTRWLTTSTIGIGILQDNGTVAGVNATSSTVTFNIRGSGTNDVLNVSSSSNTVYVKVNSGGAVNIATTTGNVYGVTVATTTHITEETRIPKLFSNVVGYPSAASTTFNLDTLGNAGVASTTIFTATTIVNPAGTLTNGNMYEFWLKATTTQTVFWGTTFASSTGLSLPSSVASGTTMFLFQYRQDSGKLELLTYQGVFMN